MYAMFTVSINVRGAFIDFFDIAFATVFVDGVAHLLKIVSAPGWLIGLLADSVGGGIQTTATFIPQIAMLFIFMSALEDSGYMSRAVCDGSADALCGFAGEVFCADTGGFWLQYSGGDGDSDAGE